jgi:hypothetical protein
VLSECANGLVQKERRKRLGQVERDQQLRTSRRKSGAAETRLMHAIKKVVLTDMLVTGVTGETCLQSVQATTSLSS